MDSRAVKCVISGDDVQPHTNLQYQSLFRDYSEAMLKIGQFNVGRQHSSKQMFIEKKGA